VPNGIFPVPEFRSGPAARPHTTAGVVARLRTRLRRNQLDEQLARGADPETSAELTLRAAQLRSAGGRRKLANALVEKLGDARGPNLGAFRMTTRRRHAAIDDVADDLLAVATRLRDGRPVDVRGAAEVSRLLNDRDSALRSGRASDLRESLKAAHRALDPAHRSEDVIAAAA
jgi:hypothetical protein